MLNLDPEEFECPIHHVALTDQVRDLLSDDRPPVAMPGIRLPGRKPRKDFSIPVTCPGDSTPDSRHTQICKGQQYWT